MKQVKIADAKNNLSRYLAYVRRGGRVRILDRSAPIADLVPIEPGSANEDGAIVASLERRGIARRGKPGPIPRDLLEPGPPDPKGAVLAALLEDRHRR